MTFCIEKTHRNKYVKHIREHWITKHEAEGILTQYVNNDEFSPSLSVSWQFMTMVRDHAFDYWPFFSGEYGAKNTLNLTCYRVGPNVFIYWIEDYESDDPYITPYYGVGTFNEFINFALKYMGEYVEYYPIFWFHTH